MHYMEWLSTFIQLAIISTLQLIQFYDIISHLNFFNIILSLIYITYCVLQYTGEGLTIKTHNNIIVDQFNKFRCLVYAYNAYLLNHTNCYDVTVYIHILQIIMCTSIIKYLKIALCKIHTCIK